MSMPSLHSKVEAPEAPRRSNHRAARILAGAALVVALLVAGIWPRITRQNRAMSVAQAAASDLPIVNTVVAKTAPPTAELLLPGNTEPVTVARIYARANGYVRQRLVDIGTRVKAGQPLAIIESPEVDQELAQARATAEQSKASLEQARASLEQSKAAAIQARSNVEAARANEEIAGTTNQRWEQLVAKGVLPKQSGDERRTAFAARSAEKQAAMAALQTAEASVRAQEANVKAAEAALNAQLAQVRRLEQVQGFQRVAAPFNGIVTERNIEQGDLVNGNGGGVTSLFSVAQAETLRIRIDVPQSYAVDMQPGEPAEVLVRELPGRKFTGTVARTAGALDNSSRTLRTEVQVDNRDGVLLPGMYAEVKFSLKRRRQATVIPAEALVVNAQGNRVIVVANDGKIRYVPVQVGRDLGTELEILDGLKGNETLIASPADTLADGQQVRLAQAEQKKEQQ